MNIEIDYLSLEHLAEVDHLGKRYRSTLGFLTEQALSEYLSRKRVFGARADNGLLAGYLLFADYPDRFRIAQFCVAPEFRGFGIARKLFEKLKSIATTQKVIRLRCRRDFEAHSMWPRLGFIPMDEKAGRSRDGLPLTLWCYHLAQDDELGLWKAGAIDDRIDVVIDAHIFYDFDAADSANTLISKGLLNDFLVDTINLWITDELFLEIDRQEVETVRKHSLNRAKGMSRVQYDPNLAGEFANLLSNILPTERTSDKSDIQHIAKTAAADIRYFTTKDEKILKQAKQIKMATDVTVVNPVDLITSIHSVSDRSAYSPTRVSGLGLQWRRMVGEDCLEIKAAFFRIPNEKKGVFLEKLRSYLSKPTEYCCELLLSENEVVAIRCYSLVDGVDVLFARISSNTDASVFGSYLIADTLALAAKSGFVTVTFRRDNITPALSPILRFMDFGETISSNWMKPLLCKCVDYNTALEVITANSPELADTLSNLPISEFEKRCSPAAISREIPNFLIPIKPAFAMGLIDNEQAANDLFGGDATVLLRWHNVYYRKKSRHRMLQAPGRILWYVSGKIGALIGVSMLDEVDVGPPKRLFKKYRKFGVLEWNDLYEMSGKDVNTEIMALKFSRTFMFQHSIHWDTLKTLLNEESISPNLQSPIAIPYTTLAKCYEIGFTT